MPEFSYTAKAKDGRTDAGTIEAPSRREALRRLQLRGVRPTSLHEGSAPAPAAQAVTTGADAKAVDVAALFQRKRRLTRAHQLPFLKSLADLVRSGMSAGEAIRLLAVRLRQPVMQMLCRQVWQQVSEGRSLSAAMAAMPEVFEAQTINLIAAGEATGNLHEVLVRLIHHFEQRAALRRTLVAALSYPVFVCCLAVGIVIFFIVFLLPRLEGLMSSLGGKLPLVTRVLMAGGHMLLDYGLYGVAAAVVIFVFVWRWGQTPPGRRALDGLWLRLPIVGELVRRSTVLGFSQTMAVLLENGVTTAETLKLSERTVNNVRLREAFAEATRRVLEGEALSRALGRTKAFPELFLDRLGVGEQTGSLVATLQDVSQSYQAELQAWLKGLTGTISAGVLLFAFSFVGLIAYAMVVAVYEVSSKLSF